MRTVSLVGLVAAGRSGVPRYATELLRGLDRVSGEYPDLELRLVTTATGARRVDARNLAVVVLPGSRKLDAGPARLVAEQLAAVPGRSLLHFFDSLGPFLAPRRRFTTTVHDAQIVATPKSQPPVRRAYKRLLVPWALRRAAGIVAVSAFARDEAVRHFAAPVERIRVIHEGPGLLPHGTAIPAQPAPAALVYVGSLSSGKNLPFLVRAFDRAGADARLLLAGRPGPGFREIESAVRAASCRDRIAVIRSPSDAEVDRLYRSSLALAFSSRYEGFGLPPLEAMRRGCPVLASDIPAVREVSGPGALLLPLDDEGAWSEAIAAVCHDPALRQELRDRGRAHVARFSWDESARSLCRFFLEFADPA